MRHIKPLSKVSGVMGAVLLFCVVASAGQPAQESRVSQRPLVHRDKKAADALILGNGVSGEIRWKKAYGLPYNTSNDGRPVHPFPCQVFKVQSTTAVINKLSVQLPAGLAGAAGTVSGTDFGTAGPPPEDGEYYVCRFAVSDLPLNRPINVQVEIDAGFLPPEYKGFDRSVRLTAPWVGGLAPQPPAGQQRRVVGNRQVSLSEKEPRARLVFEMVYAQ